jgi:hypothetical protein
MGGLSCEPRCYIREVEKGKPASLRDTGFLSGDPCGGRVMGRFEFVTRFPSAHALF